MSVEASLGERSCRDDLFSSGLAGCGRVAPSVKSYLNAAAPMTLMNLVMLEYRRGFGFLVFDLKDGLVGGGDVMPGFGMCVSMM